MSDITERLATLGIESEDITSDDLVESAMVLLKVVDGSNLSRVVVLNSDGMSGIEKVGILDIARHIELGGWLYMGDEGHYRDQT